MMWTMMAWNIAGGLGGVECKNHESGPDLAWSKGWLLQQ
jgi:hypothetical protein